MIMKNISLSLNVILIIAVAILYYFHFSSNTATANIDEVVQEEKKDTVIPLPTEELDLVKSNIAYIELDSLQLNYKLYKELERKSKAKEKQYTKEFGTKRSAFEEKVQKFQQGAASMAQFEIQVKEKELAKERDELLVLEQRLSNKLQNELIEMNNQIAVEIKNYVAEYNKDFDYDLVIGATQAGNIILYKKEGINLTTPVTEGLNQQYTTEKEKK